MNKLILIDLIIFGIFIGIMIFVFIFTSNFEYNINKIRSLGYKEKMLKFCKEKGYNKSGLVERLIKEFMLRK